VTRRRAWVRATARSAGVDVAAIGIKAAPAPVTFGGGVVVLLALAIFINYVDRGNLATAAPLMKDELHLSASRIGLLLSAFFWTYVPAQLLASWLMIGKIAPLAWPAPGSQHSKKPRSR
jgi:Major Facilitator Superfamily